MTPDPELAVMLRRNPKMRIRIMRAHRPDRSGRCRLCRAGGDGSGHLVSPCNLLLAARAAEQAVAVRMAGQ